MFGCFIFCLFYSRWTLLKSWSLPMVRRWCPPGGHSHRQQWLTMWYLLSVSSTGTHRHHRDHLPDSSLSMLILLAHMLLLLQSPYGACSDLCTCHQLHYWACRFHTNRPAVGLGPGLPLGTVATYSNNTLAPPGPSAMLGGWYQPVFTPGLGQQLPWPAFPQLGYH